MKKVILSLLTIVLLMFCTCQGTMADDKLPARVRMILVKVSPLLEQQQYDKAAKILRQFREDTSNRDDTLHDHAEINFVLGNCHTLLGQLVEARSCYQRAVARSPQHLGAWQNLAKTEYELGNYIPAGEAFFKSYRLTENRAADLLYYSAIALLLSEQYQPCLDRFDILIANHPEAITLQWKENLVYAWLQSDQPKKALSSIIELAQGFTGPKQQQWQQILLQQYMALDMRKEALDLVTSLTRQAPAVPVWWKGLAHIQLQYNNYREALAAMTIYSFLSPMTREEEKLLGDLYMQHGIPQKAVKNYEKCIQNKIDRQTILSLSRSYLELNLPEIALDKLNILSENSNDQEIEILKGEIFYSTKKYSQAAAAFERAATNQGKNTARAFLMAGYSYWQLGEHESAKKVFAQAGKQKSLEKEAQRALNQLTNLTNTKQPYSSI